MLESDIENFVNMDDDNWPPARDESRLAYVLRIGFFAVFEVLSRYEARRRVRA